MTVYLENEYTADDLHTVLPFDPKELAALVSEMVLDQENCPFEAQVNLLLTDNEGIHEINRDTRGIDAPTDVLSFPAVQYAPAADFASAEEDPAGCFDPESGELLLGDIVVNIDRVREQAEQYGHSVKREFAFLIAHSTLHLIGYDHMVPEEEADMIMRQERALTALGITRD